MVPVHTGAQCHFAEHNDHSSADIKCEILGVLRDKMKKGHS